MESRSPDKGADEAVDRASLGVAGLSFVLPPLGAMTYFMARRRWPLRARSALRGTSLGVIGVVLAAVFLPLLGRSSGSRRDPCKSNLKQMWQAAMQYQQQNDGRLPDLSSAASIRAALGPYAPGPEIFVCPTSHQPYEGNTDFSFREWEKIKEPGQKVLFGETTSVHVECLNVCHGDGRVELVGGWRPPRIWKEELSEE